MPARCPIWSTNNCRAITRARAELKRSRRGAQQRPNLAVSASELTSIVLGIKLQSGMIVRGSASH